MEQGAYRRCYEYVVRLQILDEIESFAKIEPTAEAMENMFTQWKKRLEYSQYSLSNLEPVLKIRRTLLNLGTEQFPSLKIVLKVSSLLWLNINSIYFHVISDIFFCVNNCYKTFTRSIYDIFKSKYVRQKLRDNKLTLKILTLHTLD